MTITDAARHRLHQQLIDIFGEEGAATFMEQLTPVDWADVATKSDLALLSSDLDARFDAIDARFDGIDSRFEAIDARFDGVDSRFEAIDARFDGIDARLNGIDARFDGIDARFEAIDSRFESVDARFDAFDFKLNSLRAEMKAGFEVLTAGQREFASELRSEAHAGHTRMLRWMVGTNIALIGAVAAAVSAVGLFVT